MTDVLIVVPARMNSSRLPGKPLVELGGAPLIVRVLEQVRGLDVPCLVATDDERVAAVVRAQGGEVVMTSPACPSGTDRVAEVMASRPENIVINVQGDEPFVAIEPLRALISLMRIEPQLPMATLACPLEDHGAWHSPSVVKVVCDRAGYALYFSRAGIPFFRDEQGVPSGALRHIGVYAYRRGALLELAGVAPSPLERIEQLEQLRALQLGWRVRVLTVASHWTGIDTAEDLKEAQEMWRRMHPTES